MVETIGFPMFFSFNTQVAWSSEEAQTLEVLAEEVGGAFLGGFSLAKNQRKMMIFCWPNMDFM
jgi:hypothetical protein